MSSTEIIEQFTGFGLYDKSFVETLRQLDDPTPFMRGLVAELGPERKEIEYEQPKRRAGKTHNNFFTLYDAAMLSFTSYTKSGLRIATFAGFIIAFLSFLFGLAYLVLKLVFWNRFTAGYAPMMISVFFLGGLLLSFLGFLGEYVMAINVRVMNRPLVVEEERINFDRARIEDYMECLVCIIQHSNNGRAMTTGVWEYRKAIDSGFLECAICFMKNSSFLEIQPFRSKTFQLQ